MPKNIDFSRVLAVGVVIIDFIKIWFDSADKKFNNISIILKFYIAPILLLW